MAYRKDKLNDGQNELNMKELSDNDVEEPLVDDTARTPTDTKRNASADAGEKDEVESDSRCGWGSWQPRWAQSFNNPKGYLFLLSVQAFLQGMIAFGFIYVVISTLEKRFNLSSVSTGAMVSCYDIASMSVVVFVSYFGERGSIPRWVGFGGLIFATGAILFSLPHFFTEFYDFEVTEFDICDANRTISEECDPSLDNSGLSKYLYWFMFANVLMGVGGSPLYTLGVTYMDENIMPEDFGFYIGIFSAASGLGPALGYLIGGLMLTVYTDLNVDRNELNITPDSPVWVGAWWLAFIIGGAIMVMTSVPFLGFPKKPPNANRIGEKRKSEAQMGTEFNPRQGFINNLKDFPLAIWKLLKNIPFMMLTGAAITEWFILTGLAVFAPKYLESQFNLSVSTSALYTGAITLISGTFGSIFAGWLVQRLKLNCLGQIKFCMILVFLSALLVSGFAIYCDDIPLAGVTVKYNDSSVPIGLNDGTNITSACNQNCNCEAAFDPVCGANNVMYYTACHAGCQQEIESDGKSTYTDCTCVMESGIPLGNETVHAVGGRCNKRCQGQWIFMLIIAALLTLMFAAVVPAWTATMRCVAHSQRAFGLGLQTVLYNLLGTIPGPIVYGLFIDRSCLIWEYQCDGAATCWLYENKRFARSFLLITFIMKVLTLLCFVVCILFYKPVQGEDEMNKKGKEESDRTSATPDDLSERC